MPNDISLNQTDILTVSFALQTKIKITSEESYVEESNDMLEALIVDGCAFFSYLNHYRMIWLHFAHHKSSTWNNAYTLSIVIIAWTVPATWCGYLWVFLLKYFSMQWSLVNQKYISPKFLETKQTQTENGSKWELWFKYHMLYKLRFLGVISNWTVM